MRRIKEVKELTPFVGEKITLRILSMQDIDWYANSIYTDSYNKYMDNKLTKLDFNKIKFLLSNLVVGYTMNCKAAGECRLVIIDNETLNKIGGITIFESGKNEVSIGYWILPAYQGKGYAQHSVNIIKELVFKLSNINMIKLEIQNENIASRMVAIKTGFKHISTYKGKYTENLVFELRKT